MPEPSASVHASNDANSALKQPVSRGAYELNLHKDVLKQCRQFWLHCSARLMQPRCPCRGHSNDQDLHFELWCPLTNGHEMLINFIILMLLYLFVK